MPELILPGVDPWPSLRTLLPNVCPSAGVPGQNLTFFHRVPSLNVTKNYTTTKVYNGATVNGNYAVGLWTTTDGGVNLTRLGGTASTAQSGANAVQSAALSATTAVTAGAPLWISFSEDSATGTYLRITGWAGTLVTDTLNKTAAAYNQTADLTFASLTAATTMVWVEVS